mmetsp:Transcript_10290/g.16916  ORF Transcript_10290/g.16916 Transcript_10290/m.16916 type:complete len:264 (+) Transcript_10290:36-827(+)
MRFHMFGSGASVVLLFTFLDEITASRIQPKDALSRLDGASGARLKALTPNLIQDKPPSGSFAEENVSQNVVALAPLSRNSTSHKVVRPSALVQTSAQANAVGLNLLAGDIADPLSDLTSALDKKLGVAGIVIAVVALVCAASFCMLLASRPSQAAGRQKFYHRDRLIYEWEQDDSKMVMYINLPDGVGKHNIDIRIWPRSIRIGRAGKPAFIKDELYLSVDDEASTWKMNKRGELEICLRKVEPTEWPCVLLPHLPKQTSSSA